MREDKYEVFAQKIQKIVDVLYCEMIFSGVMQMIQDMETYCIQQGIPVESFKTDSADIKKLIEWIHFTDSDGSSGKISMIYF